VHASEVTGAGLRAALELRLADHAHVGHVRGRGLMVGIELVADRETRQPFPRAAKVTERVVAGARDAGVLVYSGTGNANGVDGDQLLLGPPFVITDDELAQVVDVVSSAIEAGTARTS
jgi:adenosylmethionine-8-amino-7-oxononanoate aminotransferase